MSKGLFGVFESTKKPATFLKKFCTSLFLDTKKSFWNNWPLNPTWVRTDMYVGIFDIIKNKEEIALFELINYLIWPHL